MRLILGVALVLFVPIAARAHGDKACGHGESQADGDKGCCGGESEASCLDEQPSESELTGTKQYGQPLEKAPLVTLKSLVDEAKKYADKDVLVEGQVRSVCSKKGCWMEVAASMDPKDPGCRVTFKDYGFFVPTTSQGAHVKVQGRLSLDAPSKTCALVAKGVELKFGS